MMMNIEALARSLEPWMRVSTWHTTHPLDEERFHKALSNALNVHGCQISYDEYKEAMVYLFERIHSKSGNLGGFEGDIERYASNAEKITSYVYDTTKT